MGGADLMGGTFGFCPPNKLAAVAFTAGAGAGAGIGEGALICTGETDLTNGAFID